jgi:hypothetical protein
MTWESGPLVGYFFIVTSLYSIMVTLERTETLLKQRGMEEAPENSKESSHSAHASGMNE